MWKCYQNDFMIASSYQPPSSAVSAVSGASSASFSWSVARQGDFLGARVSHSSWSDSTRSSMDAAPPVTACGEGELKHLSRWLPIFSQKQFAT